MTRIKLEEFDLIELSGLLARREVSSVEIANESLHRISDGNARLNAFMTFSAEIALAQAKTADSLRADGNEPSVLCGIPLAVKDNYLTKDFPTTASSRVYPSENVERDAHSVSRLRDAGMVIVGKTNMHEWAYGATNKTSSRGPTRNPWDLGHITGGSSGGSAAALADRWIPAALGSDTGGSIRIPSAACGTCGIKPSFGLVNKDGILPLSWSLDCAGPMATSVRDLRVLLSAMAEHSFASAQLTLPGASGWTKKRKMRLAIPIGKGFEIAPEVRAAFEAAIAVLSDADAEVDVLKVDAMDRGFAAWKTILHAEATAYHLAFLDKDAENYSRGVRVQLEAGRHISAPAYLAAQQYRTEFNMALATAMTPFDALVYPTLPITAPSHSVDEVEFDGVTVSTQDSMTYVAWLANFAGLPALSLPCGFDSNRLPVGMMIMGKSYHDSDVLSIGERYQQLTSWHRLSPRSGAE